MVKMQLLPFVAFLPLISAAAIHNRRALTPTVQTEGPVGLGFHFTASSARAAIRYDNGTIDDLVKVQADADYKDLIRRLADPNSVQKCETQWQQTQSTIKSVIRRINKTIGRPASRDVGILASFLSKVHHAVEIKRGSETTRRVVPVFPRLPALHEEDIYDAMQYANLVWLLAERRDYHVFLDTSAAYAGAGYGLCGFPNDAFECSDEETDMPIDMVLFLNFEKDSFSVTLQPIQEAYSQWVSASSYHLNLGYNAIPKSKKDKATFWASLEEAIVEVGGSWMLPPKKVILMGEHTNNIDFVDTVKEAIWELAQFDITTLLELNDGMDAAVLASRGAAEMAGRAEYWNTIGQEVRRKEFTEEL